MSRVRIYDPPLCCSTGVCGVDVDEELVRVSADIASLTQLGADIARHNLASEPTEFAIDEAVRSFLQVVGSAGLPLVTVDGVTVLTGAYPTRQQLRAWAGLAPGPGSGLPLAAPAPGCCGGQDTPEQAAAGAGGACC